jgi:hypothetical protein
MIVDEAILEKLKHLEVLGIIHIYLLLGVMIMILIHAYHNHKK